MVSFLSRLHFEVVAKRLRLNTLLSRIPVMILFYLLYLSVVFIGAFHHNMTPPSQGKLKLL